MSFGSFDVTVRIAELQVVFIEIWARERWTRASGSSQQKEDSTVPSAASKWRMAFPWNGVSRQERDNVGRPEIGRLSRGQDRSRGIRLPQRWAGRLAATAKVIRAPSGDN